jgi:hypothetical protein
VRDAGIQPDAGLPRLDEIGQRKGHDIGPKRAGSLANRIRYVATWARLGPVRRGAWRTRVASRLEQALHLETVMSTLPSMPRPLTALVSRVDLSVPARLPTGVGLPRARMRRSKRGLTAGRCVAPVASGNREWALTVGTFRQRDAILVKEVVTLRPSTRVAGRQEANSLRTLIERRQRCPSRIQRKQ